MPPRAARSALRWRRTGAASRSSPPSPSRSSPASSSSSRRSTMRAAPRRLLRRQPKQSVRVEGAARGRRAAVQARLRRRPARDQAPGRARGGRFGRARASTSKLAFRAYPQERFGLFDARIDNVDTVPSMPAGELPPAAPGRAGRCSSQPPPLPRSLRRHARRSAAAQAGMLAEALVPTERRTVLAWLLDPILRGLTTSVGRATDTAPPRRHPGRAADAGFGCRRRRCLSSRRASSTSADSPAWPRSAASSTARRDSPTSPPRRAERTGRDAARAEEPRRAHRPCGARRQGGSRHSASLRCRRSCTGT